LNFCRIVQEVILAVESRNDQNHGNWIWMQRYEAIGLWLSFAKASAEPHFLQSVNSLQMKTSVGWGWGFGLG
jgi:hypothetical protein